MTVPASTAAMSTILPAMHNLEFTEKDGNKPQTEDGGKQMEEDRQKPQMEKDGYLSGFDFANRRVIDLRNAAGRLIDFPSQPTIALQSRQQRRQGVQAAPLVRYGRSFSKGGKGGCFSRGSRGSCFSRGSSGSCGS